jgi:hypothetical protein
VITRFDIWIAVNKLVHTVEDDIRDQPHPGFMRAVALTDRLLERLRSAVPAATKIYAFQVDYFSGEFPKLFARHGIIYIEGVAEAVTDASRKGEVVYEGTGHIGRPLVTQLLLRFLLIDCASN